MRLTEKSCSSDEMAGQGRFSPSRRAGASLRSTGSGRERGMRLTASR